MSAKTNLPAKLPPVSSEIAASLSEVATRAVTAFEKANGGVMNVVAALDVAQAVEEMRALLDRPELKARILALQDTPIGFRTDSDPKVWNKRKNAYNTPYDWPVVRDCALEATLRGLQLCGNQWNLLAGRMYCTKEGFEYLIRILPGLTEWKPVIGVPKTANGGALVECSATWKLRGQAGSLTVTIPIKTDDYAGADQIIGKATRKFYARCYGIMTGTSMPEAEVEAGAVDVTPGGTKPAPAPSRFTRPAAPDPEDQIPGAEVPVPPAPGPEETAAAPAPEPVASVATGVPQGGPGQMESAPTPGPVEDPDVLNPEQSELAAFVNTLGKSFNDFQKAMVRLNWFPGAESWASFADLPAATVARLLRAKHGLRNELTRGGGAA